MRAIRRSIANAAFGLPAPRMGEFGAVLVNTTSIATSSAGTAYGPGSGVSEVIGSSSP